MEGTTTRADVSDDEGPTEKLRDEQKSEGGEIVPGTEGVPGAQSADSEADIKDEKSPNTE